MTGSDIRTLFENIIDDSLDDQFTVDLINAAKDMIEQDRDWEYLKKEDKSQTWNPSDTYLTLKSLPSDFFMIDSLYISTDTEPFLAIPFNQRNRYQSMYRRFYIDYAQNKFGLCGVASGSPTIFIVYLYNTTDCTITTLNSWTPVFPAKYHKLIPFFMAAIYQGAVDADAISVRMSAENKVIFDALWKGMQDWDARAKLASYNDMSRTPDYNPSVRPNVVDIDQ